MKRNRNPKLKITDRKRSRPAVSPDSNLKKTIGLVACSLFLYALFRDLNISKTLFLIAGIAGALVVSRVPVRVVVGVKYPLICLSFALSVILFLYPPSRGHLVQAVALFLSFYSIALYLATDEDKAKQPAKQMIALSLLFISFSYNLIITSRPEIILPLAITSLLFLFILNRAKAIPIVGAYIVVMLVVLYVRQCTGFGCDSRLTGAERYLLLGAALLLLLVSFLGFIKESGPIHVIAFFGSLFLSVDLIMSIGFSFRGILMHQPALALAIVSPLLGLTMKGGGGRL